MNTPDIIVLLLILVPGIWQGLKQGFIHQIVTIAALLLGVWIAYRFADGVGAQISQYVTLPENVVHILAFLLILILVYIVLALLGKILKKIAAATVGGSWDKLLGIAFAILKQAFIVGFILVAFSTVNGAFHLVSKETMDNAVVCNMVQNFTETVFPFLKEWILKGVA